MSVLIVDEEFINSVTQPNNPLSEDDVLVEEICKEALEKQSIQSATQIQKEQV